MYYVHILVWSIGMVNFSPLTTLIIFASFCIKQKYLMFPMSFTAWFKPVLYVLFKPVLSVLGSRFCVTLWCRASHVMCQRRTIETDPGHHVRQSHQNQRPTVFSR